MRKQSRLANRENGRSSVRKVLAHGLSALLAGRHALHLMPHHVHCNLTGPQFNSLLDD